MPTDVISTIGTGGTHSTPAAWMAACPSNLVTADQRWIGELLNQEFTASGSVVTIAGITTDATRYVILRTATGASFRDHASAGTNPLRYDATKGAGLRSSQNLTGVISLGAAYTVIDGLQLRHTGGNCSGVRFTANVPFTIKNSIIDIGGGGGDSFIFSENAPQITAENCAMATRATTYGMNTPGGIVLKYCTLLRIGTVGGTGIFVSFGGGSVTDCVILGYSNPTFGGSPPTVSYSATDAASMPGTGNITGLTASAQLEDIASTATLDLRAKSTGSLMAGAPISGLTTDIRGTVRDAVTPWIGAWEIAGALPPSFLRRREDWSGGYSDSFSGGF